ncbi:hypothetical protein [Streptomyces sp. NPDC059063]|uniref:hypothetical protein n=1 Tax=unclassified Streptomyces TaxID=2593676 RepID=UPI0036885AB5
MTGPEHYREAERLLAAAIEDSHTTFEGRDPKADRAIAEAQVHATLALAAATALVTPSQRAAVRTIRAWHDIAGIKPSGGDAG